MTLFSFYSLTENDVSQKSNIILIVSISFCKMIYLLLTVEAWKAPKGGEDYLLSSHVHFELAYRHISAMKRIACKQYDYTSLSKDAMVA